MSRLCINRAVGEPEVDVCHLAGAHGEDRLALGSFQVNAGVLVAADVRDGGATQRPACPADKTNMGGLGEISRVEPFVGTLRSLRWATQIDGDRTTKLDFTRCAAASVSAAAILDGRPTTRTLLSGLQTPELSPHYKSMLDSAESDLRADDELNTRSIRYIQDILMRVDGGEGGTNGHEFRSMLRRAGFTTVPAPTADPVELAAQLQPGEFFGLSHTRPWGGHHMVLVGRTSDGVRLVFNSARWNGTIATETDRGRLYRRYLRRPGARVATGVIFRRATPE